MASTEGNAYSEFSVRYTIENKELVIIYSHALGHRGHETDREDNLDIYRVVELKANNDGIIKKAYYASMGSYTPYAGI
nr:hypothetical protein [Solobacterium sp.]